MKRIGRRRSTAKFARKSTASAGAEVTTYPDGAVLVRNTRRFDKWEPGRPKGSQTAAAILVTVPIEIRLDWIIREAKLYSPIDANGKRRRGPTLKYETAQVIRAEVRRLYDNAHQDRSHQVSAYQNSQKFWTHLSSGERYSRYKVASRDHKKTIQACLESLRKY